MTLPRQRAVIITGAGSEHGIGFAVARVLGAEEESTIGPHLRPAASSTEWTSCA